MKKSCLDCKYAEWQLNPSGRILSDLPGECKFPVVLPICTDTNIINKQPIWTDLSDCECWEEKE